MRDPDGLPLVDQRRCGALPCRKVYHPRSDAELFQKSISRTSGGIHAKSGDSRTWSTCEVRHVLDCVLQLLRVKSRVDVRLPGKINPKLPCDEVRLFNHR